ncbi:MAG: pilus assembly protein PilM [Bdellovibrionota bacterium]
MLGSLFGSGAKRLVGLDFGASALKIVSGKLVGGKFLLENLTVIPLPPRAIDDRGIQDARAVLSALTQGLEMSASYKKSSFAAAVHGPGVFTKRITLPRIPKKEIPEQVRWEAEQVFPQDLSTIIVDHILLGETTEVPNSPKGTKGWDLLLVGVHQDDVLTMKSIAQESALDLKLVDIDMFVIGDLIEGMLKFSKKKFVALVDVGASATRVSVRHQGNTVFIREFPIGGFAFTDAIASQLGLSFEDAESLKVQGQDGAFPQEALDALSQVLTQWKMELQQTEDIFVSQASDATLAEWHFFGGAAKTPGLAELLNDERFRDRAKMLRVEKYLKASGKGVDKELLRLWSDRLVTAVGLGCRSA